MPKYIETRLLSYTPNQLFDLVADVESYPLFLPWCLEASIREKKKDRMVVDLVVGFKGIRETFTSIVKLDRPNGISVSCGGGALCALDTEWLFIPAPKGGCELSFQVDFTFKSKLLAGLMNLFFDLGLRRMGAAFERRAQELYTAT